MLWSRLTGRFFFCHKYRSEVEIAANQLLLRWRKHSGTLTCILRTYMLNCIQSQSCPMNTGCLTWSRRSLYQDAYRNNSASNDNLPSGLHIPRTCWRLHLPIPFVKFNHWISSPCNWTLVAALDSLHYTVTTRRSWFQPQVTKRQEFRFYRGLPARWLEFKTLEHFSWR